MLFSSWLLNRRANRSPRRSAAPRFCPALEALDDRLVPSTLTVTTTLDEPYTFFPGDGSLRGEVAAAQPGDTIVFDQSLSGQNIVVNDQPLTIWSDLTIQGPGAGQLGIVGAGVRAFEVEYGASVTISGVTLGDLDSQQYDAGGILNFGTVTLTDCTVTRNIAFADYSGLVRGGGLDNYGTMTLDGCTVAENTANTSAGVYYAEGGGIYNDGTMTIRNSTVTKNSTSGYGGGIFNDTTGTLTLDNSSVKGNLADGGDNNIANFGTLIKVSGQHKGTGNDRF